MSIHLKQQVNSIVNPFEHYVPLAVLPIIDATVLDHNKPVLVSTSDLVKYFGFIPISAFSAMNKQINHLLIPIKKGGTGTFLVELTIWNTKCGEDNEDNTYRLLRQTFEVAGDTNSVFCLHVEIVASTFDKIFMTAQLVVDTTPATPDSLYPLGCFFVQEKELDV